MSLPADSWRLLQLNHRPGAGVTGLFGVTAESVPADLPLHRGLRSEEVMVCLTTASAPPRASVDATVWKELELTTWLWPDDPWLPGLRSAAEPAQKFVKGQGAHSIPVTYRPTRRAVFRLSGHRLAGRGRSRSKADDDARSLAYIKVVRPDREADLIHRHTLLLSGHVPVPRPVDSTGDGAVALAYLPGPTAAHVFSRNPTRAPDPEHLLAVLDRLPQGVMGLGHRASWSDRVFDHARAAAAVLPAQRRRVEELAARVHRACVNSDPVQLVPTHGDFHPGNVLLGPHPVDPALGPVTGILDVDNAGPGRLSDDLACYLAHLWALASDQPRLQHQDSIRHHLKVFDEVVKPGELRARTAGVLISLIGVTARRLGMEAAERRLNLGEDLIREAERLHR